VPVLATVPSSASDDILVTGSSPIYHILHWYWDENLSSNFGYQIWKQRYCYLPRPILRMRSSATFVPSIASRPGVWEFNLKKLAFSNPLLQQQKHIQIRTLNGGFCFLKMPCWLYFPWRLLFASVTVNGSGCIKHHQVSPHTPSIAFQHLPLNSARFSYATEAALFISAQLYSDAVSTLRKVRVLVKLQALVYDILPSTTAVFSYAIGSRKLSANEQFFAGAQTVVSLLQTTQIKQGLSFIAANKVYTSTNKTTIVWIEMELSFFLLFF